MKRFTKIPDNYRKLRDEEVIRAGDIYQYYYDNTIKSTKRSIGRTVNQYDGMGYTFWRRRHTKKVVVVTTPSSMMVTTPKFPVISNGGLPKNDDNDDTKKPANVAIVSFDYPNRHGVQKRRVVQVISLDDVYLTGLEITTEDYGCRKYKYQFKKYIRSKGTTLQLIYFGPPLK